MSNSKRFGLLIVAALLVAPAFVPGPAGQGTALADQGKGKQKPKPKKASVDADQVYYGRARKFSKPAEVAADTVYASIDEFKTIRDEKLKPGEVRYELLLAKASKRFGRAVRKAAKASGYDLVAESGAVRDAESVPDITDAVIENL